VTAAASPLGTARRWAVHERRALWLAVPLVLVALQVAMGGAEPPALLDTTFSEPLDRFSRWAQQNRGSHWLFTVFFRPATALVRYGLENIEQGLLWVPWFVIPAAIFAFIARTRAWVSAAAAAAAIVYPGLVGLWEVTIETLALMTMAVILSVAVGLPAGILAALHPRLDNAVRPVLDAMQTVPAPVYFVPMVMFFGIGAVPATLATVIYALPPVVRLTTLGVKGVAEQAVEASTVFGATRAQTLRKVQLPMALPTIMTGITQTIMMALGIVVLATLLGAGGLGQEVMGTLSQRRTGRGIATGLAVVAIAAVLDRLARAVVGGDRATAPSRRTVLAALAALAGLVVAGRAAGGAGIAGMASFPEVWEVRAFDPIDDTVRWVRDNLRWLTRGFNELIISTYYIPLRRLLTDTLAWPVLIVAAAAFGAWLKGARMAVLNVAGMAVILVTGMWELSIDTFVQVVVAVVLSLLVAIPVGIAAGRNRRVEAALSPLLDALQTIPSLVYIIPAVTFFTIGIVPGVIASVLYACVPGIRLAALGIRQVPVESVEASQVFGATPRQTMLGVRIPLAAKTIMAGVNQVIMMVLAMVIISGLVGGGGLGFETISAVKNSEVGSGFEVGAAILVMAVVLDRTTQALAERVGPPDAPAE
jgi:glycine betaine/proline transport system permease protein